MSPIRPASLSRRRTRRPCALVSLGLSLTLLLKPPGAKAGQTEPLPPLDLGQTNILDGEGAPGRLLEIITFGSGAGRLTDAAGRSVPGDNDQQVISPIAHPILVSAASVLGAHPGVEVLVPVSYVNNGFAASGAGHFTRRHVPTRIRAFIDFLVEHLPTPAAEGVQPCGLPRP